MSSEKELRFVLGVEKSPGRWLARDQHGRPAVIFELPRLGKSAPRRLANLRYLPPQEMELAGRPGVSRVSAAVLSCCTDDPTLRVHFAPLCDAVFGRNLTEVGDESDIESRLDAFIALLAALRSPPQQTAQGLWAELAMIAWSERVETCARAWHEDPRALHDFTSPGEALEVKSSTSWDGGHEISLDQLDEADGNRIVFASMELELHDEGTSVGELVERIVGRLEDATALQTKVERAVHASLGRDWSEGTGVRVAEAAAFHSLKLYAAGSIPSVLRPIPPQVSRVRFHVDVGAVEPLKVEDVRQWSEWWLHALPQPGFVRL